MQKSKTSDHILEPKTPSPMQVEMKGLSLKDLGRAWRSLFQRRSGPTS